MSEDNIQKPVIVPFPQAQKLRWYYACAKCWGLLTIKDIKGRHDQHYRVVCEKCGDGAGFVTQTYIAICKDKSYSEYCEMRSNLGRLIPGLLPPKIIRTTEETLRELGY
jgi:hypothetical protein